MWGQKITELQTFRPGFISALALTSNVGEVSSLQISITIQIYHHVACVLLMNLLTNRLNKIGSRINVIGNYELVREANLC